MADRQAGSTRPNVPVLIGLGLILLSGMTAAAVFFREASLDDDVSAGGEVATADAADNTTTTTSTPTTTTTTTTTTTLPQPVSFVFVGDMMLGSDFPPQRIQPDDGAGSFARVKHLLAADVPVGNLEGPITTAAGAKCAEGSSACFAFRMPLHYIDYFVDAGFKALNTANNHFYDQGAAGGAETVSVVEGAGIAAYGEVGTVDHLEVEGVTIALIGFAPYGYANSILDIEAATATVADESARSDLVVVTFHGGAEGTGATHTPNEWETYVGEARGNTVEFSHAVIDAGADLVVGHGPHVLRGMEIHNGRLIAYSLGNFAAYGFRTDWPANLSAVLHVTLDPAGNLVEARIDPIVLDGAGMPDPDPSGASIGQIRTLSDEDFGETAPIIADDGTVTPR